MSKTKRELELSSRFVLGKISYFYLLRTRGAVCVLKEAIVENFKYLLLRTLTLCFARVRGLLFMPFLCRSTKKGRKKRNPAEPLGASRGFRRRASDAGLPRRDFCTGKRLARFLLSRSAQNLCKQGCVADGKNSCCCLLRATSVLAFFHQNASAKAESATLRQNIGDAGASTVLALRVSKGY
jgi:hypothetical protein